MSGVLLKFDKRIKDQMRRKIERYLFDVGILENKPHRAPLGTGPSKTFLGGPARRASAKVEGDAAQVSQEVRQRLGINFYRRPFKTPKDRDILAFTKSFFKVAMRDENPNRAVNLIQAVVRNPILRGEYGGNSARAAQAKGFNRLLIDTGQLFRAIRARVKVKRVP